MAEPTSPHEEQPDNAARPLIAPPWSPASTPPASYVPRPPTATPEPNDGRSFTERYRGTQWDTSPLNGLPDAATVMPHRRGGPSILLLAGVGMFVAVVAMIGVILYTDMQQPAILPAALLPTSSPEPSSPPAATDSPAATSPSPAPSALASAPPALATPVATANLTPTALPPFVLPNDPLEAFAYRMARGDATYHVAAEGDMDVGNESLAFHMEMDFAGDDVSSVIDISQKRVRARTESIVKDGIQYDRLAGDGWIRSEGTPDGLSSGIFGSMYSLDGLEYVGAVRRNGQLLHHLRFPQEYVPLLNSAFIEDFAGGMTVHDFRFDVWITGDGRARSATFKMDGTAHESGVEVDVTLDFEYRFSRWGEPIVVDAPAQYTDPGYTDG